MACIDQVRLSVRIWIIRIQKEIDYDVYTEVVVEYPLSDSATEGSGSIPNAGEDSEQCDEEDGQVCDCGEVEESWWNWRRKSAIVTKTVMSNT
jgi:hypothetical protein